MSKTEIWTPEQFREYQDRQSKANANAPRLKYGNKPQVVDGYAFDSIKEAEYYGNCKLMVRAGHLKKVMHHVRFDFVVNGYPVGSYEADFVLEYPDGSTRVVDVKSEATEGLPLFLMKKALMKACHGIDVHIFK